MYGSYGSEDLLISLGRAHLASLSETHMARGVCFGALVQREEWKLDAASCHAVLERGQEESVPKSLIAVGNEESGRRRGLRHLLDANEAVQTSTRRCVVAWGSRR